MVLAPLLRLMLILFMFFICIPISAEGARNQLEITATPLHKTGLWPLTYLGLSVETRKLDLAHALSFMMMFCVLISWEMLTYYYAAEVPINNFRRLVWMCGTVLIVCDGILFFSGIANSGFFGGSSVFAAMVMTALYVGVLVFMATLINYCQGKIR